MVTNKKNYTMRKLLLFACALFGFMACTQNPIEEQSAIRIDAPETIRVGFEDDETRIQLNSAQKTVWTKGDFVSVFYRSDANQKWQYQGETGERVGDLKRVDAGTATKDFSRVVVVYPYNDNYYINPETYNIQASLPAVQHYLANSYGLDGNIMVSSSEFTQFSLKSVCGWLKLQLTGDGAVVKSIKFRGNNDEQVAGLIYVDTATAEATLASEMGGTDDNNAGGNLVFDDTILTEVVLDCGEGVTLGKSATAFYIALPPQTFANGFTVEIEDTDGYAMEQSTAKTFVVERNTISPMAALEFVNPNRPTQPTPANNEIWYTNGSTTYASAPANKDVFGANIVSNTYDAAKECWVIKFDSEVTTIGAEAFAWCESLTSVTIPESVTTIGEWAFAHCHNLTSVTIGDSVTTIGNDAFAACEILTSVYISDISAWCNISFRNPSSNPLYSGCNLYLNNELVTDLTIPDSVTTIGDYAFQYCNSLTSITIPDSVTKIGNRAFWYCGSLTSVTIPNSVTTIGDYAFQHCSSLTSVTIPDSVTTIVDGAFYGCTSLTSVTIPDSVTSIGDGAFSRCKSLTSVTIPDSVTEIGVCAFYWCNSLTSITIPNSVTTIGYEAFWNCSSLTSVYCKPTTPPVALISYDNWEAFDYNASGRKIYVPMESVNKYKSASGWSEYMSDIVGYDFENGVAVTPKPANNEIWYTNGSTTEATTPYDTNAFGAKIVSNTYDAAKECWVIKFDGDVTAIGYLAFHNCSSLTSITIPDSVTTIVEGAFSYCSSLQEFNGKFASEDGRCLISDGVLNSFAIGCGATEYTISDSVTEIGTGAFAGCYDLTSVTIPDSVTTIGGSAFCDCRSLTSITIPNSVTTIEEWAFYGCSSLTSVTIPDSVTTIGHYAFCDCYSLTSVYCKATTPPAVTLNYASEWYAFTANASGRKIYVPMESVNAYKSASGWSVYDSYIVGYNF